MADYVKFGCEMAMTTIELCNPGRANFVIERKLVKGHTTANGKTSCTSEWTLNGKPAKQSDVKEFTKNINIGVDNLCQFLPQEKVADFVKMGPKDLLENTEKATGDLQLFKDHVSLREMARSEKELSKEKRQIEEKTRTEENVNRRAEQEVQRLKERKEAQNKIKILNLKKPWVEFEEKRLEFINEKTNLDDLKKKKATTEKKILPFKRAFEDFQREALKKESEINTKKQAIKSTSIKQTTNAKEVKRIVETANTARDEFNSKVQEFDRRQEDIKRIQQDIRNTEAGLEKKREEDVLTDLIVEVNEQMKQNVQKVTRLEAKKDGLRNQANQINGKIEDCRERMKKMDTFQRRFDLLRTKNVTAYRGYEIYMRMKDKFTRPVYPPLMTIIDVMEPQFAKYVEATIPRRDLFAFVCEDGEDMKMLSRELETKGVKCALVMAPREGQLSRPRFSLQELKPLGFFRFVSDMFTAPEAVSNYLYNQCQVQNIPVAGGRTPLTPAQISGCQEKGVQSFFSHEQRFNSSRSRYDNQYILSQDVISEAHILTIIKEESGMEREQEKIAELQEELKAVFEKGQEIDVQIKILKEQERSDIQAKKKTLQGELEEVQTAKKKLQLKRAELKRKVNSTFDKEAELAKIKQVLQESFKKIVKLLTTTAKVGEETVVLMEKRLESQIVCSALNERKTKAEAAWKLAQTSLVSLTQAIKDQEMKIDSLKVVAKEKRTMASRSLVAAGYRMDNNELPESIREKFTQLPDTLVELQAEISTLNAKIQGMGDEWNDQAEEDYARRTAEITANKERIKDLGLELQTIESEMSVIKERWITPLNAMIERINKSFSESMKSLGYAGEVTLKGEGNNFEEYGIVVRVKYRDSEDVQELSAFTQSGGERSVATVIYMMALQELTKVPFRAVDEINQGMDSTNERKIFNLIVKNAVNNSSQYFLLTPKLLKGLTYPDKIEVHVINNGAELEKNFVKHLLIDNYV